MSTSPMLLGVPDARINSSVTWQVNKIGGYADLMVKFSTPVCVKCLKSMVHILQIYCPLELSPFCRVLHIFACISKPCWNQGHAWRVFRSEQRDTSAGLNNNASTVTSATKKADVVVMETSDWCDGADDWGDEDDAQDVSMATNDFANCGTPLMDNASTGHVDSSDGVNEQTFIVEQPRVLNMDESLSKCLDNLHVDSETVGVDSEAVDVDSEAVGVDSGAAGVDSETVGVGSETVGVGSETVGEELASVEEHVKLTSYYLDVFEDVTVDNTDSKHVMKLLKDYQEMDGSGIGKGTDRQGGKSNSEKYEKSDVKHGDRFFYKFLKVLKQCPEQVVRYQYNGDAMPIAPLSGAPPICPACGAIRFFELQVLSTLIPHLHIDGRNGPVVEFGNILIYTCSQSCWNELHPTTREEFLIVQPDPDHHRFQT